MVVKIGVEKSDSLNPTVYNPLYDPTKRGEQSPSVSVPKAMLIDGNDPYVHSNSYHYSFWRWFIVTTETVRRLILTAS